MSAPEFPHFELRRIDAAGGDEEPRVIPLDEVARCLTTTRRGFLSASLATSALIAAAQNVEAASADPTSATKVLRAHNDSITDLAISADSRFVVTGSRDKKYKCWSLETFNLLHASQTQDYPVTAVSFAGSQPLLAVATGDGSIHIGNAHELHSLKALSAKYGAISDLLGSPDGTLLVAAGNDAWVGFFSLPSGDIVEQVRQHREAVNALAVNAAGTLLATGDAGGTIKLWSLPQRTILHTFRAHTGPVTKLCMLSEAGRMISRSDDRSLGVWDLAAGRLLRMLKEHWSQVANLSTAPQGDLLATSSRYEISLWTMPEGELLRKFVSHRADVQVLEITPDGRLLVSGDANGTVIVWDLATKTLASYLYDPEVTNSSVKGMVFDVTNEATQIVTTYTLPCGAPIPPGAVCTCNCIPGKLISSAPAETVVRTPRYQPRNVLPRPRYRAPSFTPPMYIPRFNTQCTCNLICTCIPVCHAHRLLHGISYVRDMAEQLLLMMGSSQLTYLRWAACQADGRLRRRIDILAQRIVARESPVFGRLPDQRRCFDLLDDADEVVATMGAQILAVRYLPHFADWPTNVLQHVGELIIDSWHRPWWARYRVIEGSAASS